ncbi:hypothetical protein G3A39_39065 [Paraburkholderia aspalathi]|nr:hypothetical protein [Paraburkholderia aspalathi]
MDWSNVIEGSVIFVLVTVSIVWLVKRPSQDVTISSNPMCGLESGGFEFELNGGGDSRSSWPVLQPDCQQGLSLRAPAIGKPASSSDVRGGESSKSPVVF